MAIYRTTNPTEFDDVDGIIINEVTPIPSILGVPSNIGILVGQFQRGPLTLVEPGSIGSFLELYGKSTFSGNKQLKNKRFGRLRIVRAAASDAVKATLSPSSKIKFDAKYVGVYGNSIQVKIEDADDDVAAVQEVTSITCVADVSDSLDGTYFILEDAAGTVAFWIDTDDSGTSEPSHGADRAVEITTIVTDDDANTVATKVATAINADSEFSAPAPGANIVLATNADAGARTAQAAGTSGFTVAEDTAGVDAVEAGVTYTIRDNNTGSVLADEVYKNIKIAEITSATFAASQLVDVTVLLTDAEPANQAFTNLASGAEGSIADTDYETAIGEAAVEGAGNLLFLDEYNSTRNGYLKTHAAATQDKMVVVCGPEVQARAAAVTDVANYRDVDGRIIYAYPYIESTINGALEFTPPASWLASIITQTSPHIDPAFSGNSQFLSGVTDLKLTLNNTDYIALKDAGVCAFEYDPDIGFKIKSGIVTQIANSGKVTILRRRMADYLTSSAAKFLKNFQNAVNNAANRSAVKGAFLEFIQRQERDGILPGDSEVSDGLAKVVDTESLNTNSSIALGFFKILWRQRIFSSMRYIVLQAEIGENVVVTEQE